MASDRKARVGVIGCGWWSTYTHIPGLKEYPSAELVALADQNPERLQAAAKKYEVERTYTDYRHMLANERLDGVVVAVNHAAHYEVAKAALEAGLHIMLEKPMVLEAAHARELVDLARRQGREIIVGYPWHYTETARRAREIVQSGRLGEIQFVSSLFASMVIEFYRGNPEAYRPVFNYPVTGPGQAYADPKLSGGGQGHLQVTHSAGLMFFVTGLRARRVAAEMERFDLPVDLVDAISVRFDNGAVGVVGSTGNIGVGDGGQHDLRVYCSRGYLLMEMVDGTMTVRTHDGTVEQIGPLPEEERYPRFATAHNLVDVILGRAQNGSPGEVGARTVELLDAAYRSAAQEGRPVTVS
ncbi:MAG TPA: Gfo/Idh/MocA family oxidoreductase [Chloroflexota bacterium]